MWQRFTENARQVIFFAMEEAQKFGEGYLSTEHILLGMTRDGSTRAARSLAHLDVALPQVRSEIERQLPREAARSNQDMTLTPRAKRVIDLAYDEARGLDNNYIGTEHLLLGLLREGQGFAGRVLQLLGVELEACREAVRLVQSGYEVDSGAPSRPVSPRPLGHLAKVPFLEASALMADILAEAWKFAQSLGQPMRSEHVLLALCRREDFYASDILARHGITVESLLEELRSTPDEPDDPANRDE